MTGRRRDNQPRRHGRRAPIGVAVLSIVLAGCGSTVGSKTASTPGPWSGTTIRIGAIYSTSGAGAAYGPQSILGAELAARQINRSGVLRGAKLQLVFKNDGSNPATAARETKTLINTDKVIAILGPTLSNAAGSSHAVADQSHTVVLATSNTGPGIVGDCAYPCQYVFRDSLGEQAAIPANISDYGAAAHPRTAAVIYATPGDSLGQDQAAIAEQALPLNGIQLLQVVSYPAGTADLGPYVAKAITSSPDLLIDLGSSSASLASVMQIARHDGYLGKFLGGNTFNSTDVASAASADGLGAQSAAAWYLGNSFPANVQFVSAYESAYQKNPDEFAAQAYTGVELIADALSRSNLRANHIVANRNALFEALPQTSMQTPLGPFSFTPTHDVQQPIWIVQMNGRGGFTLVNSELVNTP